MLEPIGTNKCLNKQKYSYNLKFGVQSPKNNYERKINCIFSWRNDFDDFENVPKLLHSTA